MQSNEPNIPLQQQEVASRRSSGLLDQAHIPTIAAAAVGVTAATAVFPPLGFIATGVGLANYLASRTDEDITNFRKLLNNLLEKNSRTKLDVYKNRINTTIVGVGLVAMARYSPLASLATTALLGVTASYVYGKERIKHEIRELIDFWNKDDSERAQQERQLRIQELSSGIDEHPEMSQSAVAESDLSQEQVQEDPTLQIETIPTEPIRPTYPVEPRGSNAPSNGVDDSHQVSRSFDPPSL